MSKDTGHATDDTQTQDATSQAQTTDTQAQAADATPDPTVDFDGWLKAQPEAVRNGYAAATSGLKSALEKERDRASEVEKKLRDAVKKLDGVAGAEEAKAELQARLDEAQVQRDAAQRKADFVLAAVGERVVDPELAWLAVSGNESLLDRRGNVDFDKLRQHHPSLFVAETATRGNAGDGQDRGGATRGSGGKTFSDVIREKAGR